MNQLKFVFTAYLLFFIVTNSCSQKNVPRSSSVLGVFVASTPCSHGTRPLPGIPGNADCEFIKMNLTLYEDKSEKTSATFKLHCVYGLAKQGTTGFIGEEKKLRWKENG